MYCRHCGKEIKDDSRFCEFCGTAVLPVGEVPVPAAEPASTPFAAGEPTRPVNGVPEGAHVSLSIQESGARRKKVVKAVSLTLLILVVGLGGFGLWSHFHRPDPAKLDEAAYKEKAVLISYDDFFLNTAEYDDVLAQFSGTVSESGGKGSDSWFLLDTYYDPATALYYGGTVLVRGDESLLSAYKAGQNVTVYGVTSPKRQTKTTATGIYDIPVIRVKYIDKL